MAYGVKQWSPQLPLLIMYCVQKGGSRQLAGIPSLKKMKNLAKKSFLLNPFKGMPRSPIFRGGEPNTPQRAIGCWP